MDRTELFNIVDNFTLQSLEAERSIIGGLLVEPFKADDLVCTVDDFYHYANKKVFEVIMKLSDENKAIDTVTVAEYLDAEKQLDSIGGLGYLVDLVKNTAGSNRNIKHYSEIVRDKALIRELAAISNTIAMQCDTPNKPASELIADAESAIFAIGDKRETSEPVGINVAVQEAIDHLGDVIDGLTYQSTGLNDLDALIGGLRGGATYVIAARSSMGKTALLCSIAHHVAQSMPIYIVTLEMPRREIATRLMAIDGNVNIGNAKNWDALDYDKITKASATVNSMPITIDHEEGLSLTKLRARARRLKRKKNIGCIFVDYLQLMKSKAETREREVAQISEGLKSLAKELDVPVVVLAQLNRDCDKRADKRPLMSDLRESGSIEQDADVIMMLYRDEVYNKDTQYKGMAEILVRKNRHGAIGDVYATYIHEYMAFKNKSHDWMPPLQDYSTKPKRGFDYD